MAGDWIKMRMDLSTSPKVVRMSSALKADRFRIVGGLHSAWCLFDAHSEDGRLEGYTLESLDDLIGFKGFASAMADVGWIENHGDCLCMPRFDEHNGQSAKRRAMDTERKREVRKMSANDTDKKTTREEKRREEKTIPKGIENTALTRPDIVSQDVWNDFLTLRKAKKAPLTKTALNGIENEARKAGMTLEAAMVMACNRGWTAFKADWVNGKQSENKQTALEARNAAVMEQWLKESA